MNGLRGNGSLISYAVTKGAVVAFTYSMAQALANRGIRANAVAPGPVWTPLIPSTLEPEKVAKFGQRLADLQVYVRQHHAERDLAALGRMVLAAESAR